MTTLEKTAAALLAAEEGGPSYIGMRESVPTLIAELLAAMFPRHMGAPTHDSVEERLGRLTKARTTLLYALGFVTEGREEAEQIADGFFGELPDILAVLKTDILAAYQGDPAARHTDEIILSYPAFTAISTFIGIVFIRPLVAVVLVYAFHIGLVGVWIALVSDALVCYALAIWRWKSEKWASIVV